MSKELFCCLVPFARYPFQQDIFINLKAEPKKFCRFRGFRDTVSPCN